jgi:hypothetical protein
VSCLTISLAGPFVPRSQAIDLVWGDGSKNLTLASTSVCTLVVKPSGDETLLPGRWRLIYTGSCSCPSESALVFMNAPGPSGAAPVCGLDGPSSAAEELSKQITVTFCGPGDGQSTGEAAFVVLVDASLHARIAAVPASEMLQDAGQPIGPNSEVTVNGGSDLEYPPTIWNATQLIDSTGAAEIVLSGIGLDQVSSVSLLQPGTAAARLTKSRNVANATDTLPIVTQTPGCITVNPNSPVSPGTELLLTGDDGTAAAAAPVATPQGVDGTSDIPGMFPGGTIRPKDFAFIYELGQFHLFYIIHDTAKADSLTEKELGHAVSTDLYHWTQLAPVIHADTTSWDNAFIWAPTIIKQNGTFFMFYTGVSKTPGYNVLWGYQRIGVATSTDLMNWTRYSAPVFGGVNAPWVFVDSTQYDGCQFRDPFVMVDPGNSSRWLMYYVATPFTSYVDHIVGVGQNATGLAPWSDVMPMWNTDTLRYQGKDESPHVFAEPSVYYLFFTTNSGHPIQVQYAPSVLADSAQWQGTWSLFNVLGNNNPDIDNWYASEHLTVAGHDYLAFVHDADRAIEFREMTWGPPPTGGAKPTVTVGLPTTTAVSGGVSVRELGLTVLGRIGFASPVAVRATLPASMAVRVDVFDLGGRRIRQLVNGTLPAGSTDLTWNGADDGMRQVESGIYFVRLRTPHGTRSARVPLFH